MKTNVGEIFMRLVDKHFPRNHKYYKLFNRNNIKLNYSYIRSMNNVIRKHNSKIMKDPAPFTTKTCNCRCKTDCPKDGSCLSEYLFTKHLLIQLLIKITMVVVKVLSRNVKITVNISLETNLVKKH